MGNRFGVAKSAYLVPVKIAAALYTSDVSAALVGVLQDIRDNRAARKGKAVVVMSILSAARYDYQTFVPPGHREYQDWDRWITAIKAENVPVVACSGNDADKGIPILDSVPQLFKTPSVINVAAITLEGKAALFSQVAPPQSAGYRKELWAPGAKVTCAQRDGTSKPAWGTSYAAPMVSLPSNH